MPAKVKEKKSPEKIGSEEIISDVDIISENTDKKNKKKEKDKKVKKEKKGIRKLVPLFVFLLVVGALVATIGFNAFGVREKYARGLLEKVPIVNNLLPAAPTSTEEEGNAYSNLSNAELINQIERLNNQLVTAEEKASSLQEKNDLYAAQLVNFQEIESQQQRYKDEKAEFDRMITENDPAAYKKFYESIEPENAAVLYKEAVTANQQTQELKRYVSTVQNMSESDAAGMLQEMISTDMNLVVLIMNNIDSETSGAILGAMDPKDAASVFKRMAPVGQQ